MWGTQLLILLMSLLISAFSLPEDIKHRTIYTIMTKPVRASELVMGRILGFAATSTVLLLILGVISLLFVWRGLSHTHVAAADQSGQIVFETTDATSSGRRSSQNAISSTTTQQDSGHTHYVEVIEETRGKDAPPPVDADSIISKETRGDVIVYKRLHVVHAGGHTHSVKVGANPDILTYSLSDAKGFFRARIPHYADRLVFYDPSGTTSDKGVNVGDTWNYRSYIAGGTNLSRAEFVFDEFRANHFENPDLIPLELNLGIFRTRKGEIRKRIRVAIRFESVFTGADSQQRLFRSDVLEFESDEFVVQVKGVPRKIAGQVFDKNGQLLESGVYDLFDDYAANEQLRLVLRCPETGQYIGVAKADVYFRAAEGIYWVNFAKGYLGIWMQMIIVVSPWRRI